MKHVGSAVLAMIIMGGAIVLAWMSAELRLGDAGSQPEGASSDARDLSERLKERRSDGTYRGDVPLQTEKRIALVIGNSAYHRAALAHASNDARLLEAKLKELHFEVSAYYDVGLKDMKRAARAFSDALKQGGKNTVAFIYYAGHGVQVNGENYLIPVDENITNEGDVDIEAVNVSSIMSIIEHAETRLNIVVLDACRNNPFVYARSGARGLARIDAPSGSLVAFSTAPGKAARDDSPYAATLAQELGESGLKIEEVFKKVRLAVRDATRNEQTPWEHTSVTGEFYPAGKPSTDEAARREGEMQRKEVEIRQREEVLRRKEQQAPPAAPLGKPPVETVADPAVAEAGRGWLGVSLQPVTQDIAKSMFMTEATGALVAKVYADGPSANSKLKAGDVVIEVNGDPVNDSAALVRKIAELKPQTYARLTIFQAGRRTTVTVKLGEMPGQDRLAILESEKPRSAPPDVDEAERRETELARKEAELKQRQDELQRMQLQAEMARKEAVSRQREAELRAEMARKKDEDARQREAELRRMQQQAALAAKPPADNATERGIGVRAQPAPSVPAVTPQPQAQIASIAYCQATGAAGMFQAGDQQTAEANAISACISNGGIPECCQHGARSVGQGCIALARGGAPQQWGMGGGASRNDAIFDAVQRCGVNCRAVAAACVGNCPDCGATAAIQHGEAQIASIAYCQATGAAGMFQAGDQQTAEVNAISACISNGGIPECCQHGARSVGQGCIALARGGAPQQWGVGGGASRNDAIFDAVQRCGVNCRAVTSTCVGLR